MKKNIYLWSFSLQFYYFRSHKLTESQVNETAAINKHLYNN